MSNEQSAEQHKAGHGVAGETTDAERHEEGDPSGPARTGEDSGDTAAAEADTGTEAGIGDEAAAPEESAGATGPAGDEEAESPEAEIARLQQELAAAQAQAEDYWNRLVRSEAEKENVRKRAEKDVDSARKQALEKLAGELLAVRDSLEMGVDAARQDDAEVEKIREGTELTLKMLTQAMDKFSIEEIDPTGEKFNPDLHQAMSMQEVEGYEPNTVISVMQKGYRIGDRLLRPALVMVAK